MRLSAAVAFTVLVLNGLALPAWADLCTIEGLRKHYSSYVRPIRPSNRGTGAESIALLDIQLDSVAAFRATLGIALASLEDAADVEAAQRALVQFCAESRELVFAAGPTRLEAREIGAVLRSFGEIGSAEASAWETRERHSIPNCGNEIRSVHAGRFTPSTRLLIR